MGMTTVLYGYIYAPGEAADLNAARIALLLAAYSLPVPLANRVLLFAGYAPLHHRALARKVA